MRRIGNLGGEAFKADFVWFCEPCRSSPLSGAFRLLGLSRAVATTTQTPIRL
jgi:hypothetical protein